MKPKQTQNVMRQKATVVPFRQLSAERQHFFKAVFEEHHQALHKFILRLGVQEDNCRDLAQDVYLRLVRQNEPDKLSEAPRAYLYTIAANLVRDQIRKNHRRMADQHVSYEEADVPANQPMPDEQLDMRQRLDLLRKAIMDLPPEKQRIFLLSRFQDLGTREIADMLKISRRTVQRYLNDALLFCQRRVTPESEEDIS